VSSARAEDQRRAASNRAMAVFMLLFPRNPFAAVTLEVVAIVQCRSASLACKPDVLVRVSLPVL
jgi:hypothetical protein